jgi:hypothetical protein
MTPGMTQMTCFKMSYKNTSFYYIFLTLSLKLSAVIYLRSSLSGCGRAGYTNMPWILESEVFQNHFDAKGIVHSKGTKLDLFFAVKVVAESWGKTK